MPPAIFITARFRTGSTLLWNIFRQIPAVTAYYEPLHATLPEWIRSAAPPQPTHYHVDRYFDAYPPIAALRQVHAAEFGVNRLYLEATDQHLRLKQYLQYLIEMTVPAPREQWFSSIREYPGALDDNLDADPYLITTWYRDLCLQFPFLAGYFIRHPYQRHYYLWKLSFLAGKRLGDISVAYEDLLNNASDTLRALFHGIKFDVGAFFLEHPEIDVVYGHRIVIDEQDREIGRWVLPPHDNNMLLWADYVPQETLFWRRRIWEKAGAYVDESYHFALDWELLLRFYDAGAKFVRLPRFLAGFRVHEAQKTSQELEGRGWQEMSKLRKQRHGRDISNEEALHHLRNYMRNHLIYHAFYRAGPLK